MGIQTEPKRPPVFCVECGLNPTDKRPWLRTHSPVWIPGRTRNGRTAPQCPCIKQPPMCTPGGYARAKSLSRVGSPSGFVAVGRSETAPRTLAPNGGWDGPPSVNGWAVGVQIAPHGYGTAPGTNCPIGGRWSGAVSVGGRMITVWFRTRDGRTFRYGRMPQSDALRVSDALKTVGYTVWGVA